MRFDEQGQPVRAFLECTFDEFRDYKDLYVANPLNSPDTTKYHTVRQGDSLWALAAEEYGDAGQWRVIAEVSYRTVHSCKLQDPRAAGARS